MPRIGADDEAQNTVKFANGSTANRTRQLPGIVKLFKVHLGFHTLSPYRVMLGITAYQTLHLLDVSAPNPPSHVLTRRNLLVIRLDGNRIHVRCQATLLRLGFLYQQILWK